MWTTVLDGAISERYVKTGKQAIQKIKEAMEDIARKYFDYEQ